MSPHFRAFSFVDRITALQAGVSIRGTYAIPADLPEFSSSLVSEALGQLAAWAAMAAVDFKGRPVAGIAGKVELLRAVQPGETLELAVDLDSVDEDAAGYDGWASVNGIPVLRLSHCVGPMLPVVDFDAPEALRERFVLISNGGATPGAFEGLPAIAFENVTGAPGEIARATLQLPVDAPFFGDHFPRKPVFPGSLLMQQNLKLVGQFAAQIPLPTGAKAWQLDHVSGMKLRSFLPPGEIVELEAKLGSVEGKTATVAVESRRMQKLVGAASVVLTCGV